MTTARSGIKHFDLIWPVSNRGTYSNASKQLMSLPSRVSDMGSLLCAQQILFHYHVMSPCHPCHPPMSSIYVTHVTYVCPHMYHATHHQCQTLQCTVAHCPFEKTLHAQDSQTVHLVRPRGLGTNVRTHIRMCKHENRIVTTECQVTFNI